MRVFRAFWLALPVGIPLASAANPPSRIPVTALFSNPVFSSPDLSDDGTRIVYILSKGDLRVIVAQPLSGGAPTALAKFDDPQTRPNRLEWANDRRILISAHARDHGFVGMRSRFTRLYAVDSDGSNFTWLGRDWPVHGWRALQSGSQDNLLHLTPRDPQTILIRYWPGNEDSPQVMRLDVDSGELSVAEKRQRKIRDWHADGDGKVRAGAAIFGGSYQLWTRVDASQDFKLAIEYDRYDFDGLRFAGFHRDPRKIYVSMPHDGRRALFEFDLESRTAGTLVEAHSEVDVDTIELSDSTREAIGVSFTDDRHRVRYFDGRLESDMQRISGTLAEEFGREVDVDPVSQSADGTKLVLAVSSDRLPPFFYFFDRSNRQLSRLFATLPDVPVESLAPTRRVTFRARDGLPIPAYLTLPVGVDPRDLPAVALVHGGPWSRDAIEWDPEVQLLANRGFAVLQVNFRGSTGFGKAFRDAGNREWGQRMQDDITDGVRWLIDQGIADGDRIGIMGTSFGGYAALMGLVKTPELYRAGIAYAAVTDIETSLANDHWLGSDHGFDRLVIGGEFGDADRLRQSSPLRRASEIRVPVLLGHGEDDQRVHVRESQAMAEALRAANARYEYVEFQHEIHGFALENNRIRWYERVAGFLEEHLAPRVRPAATP
jgi:dipeptidyl aminopeptidase/acylaminoacyl peptidase